MSFLSADVRFHFCEITESFPTHSFTSQLPKQLCCHLLSWHLYIFDLCLKRFIYSCLNGDAEQREGEWAYSTWHHIWRCNLPLFTLKSKWILTNNYCTDGPWCLPGPYTGSWCRLKGRGDKSSIVHRVIHRGALCLLSAYWVYKCLVKWMIDYAFSF